MCGLYGRTRRLAFLHITLLPSQDGGNYLISGPAFLFPLCLPSSLPILGPYIFFHLDYITHRSRNLGRKLTYCICHASAPDVQVRLNPLQTSRQQIFLKTTTANYTNNVRTIDTSSYETLVYTDITSPILISDLRSRLFNILNLTSAGVARRDNASCHAPPQRCIGVSPTAFQYAACLLCSPRNSVAMICRTRGKYLFSVCAEGSSLRHASSTVRKSCGI